jgi:hypothetical protein
VYDTEDSTVSFRDICLRDAPKGARRQVLPGNRPDVSVQNDLERLLARDLVLAVDSDSDSRFDSGSIRRGRLVNGTAPIRPWARRDTRIRDTARTSRHSAGAGPGFGAVPPENGAYLHSCAAAGIARGSVVGEDGKVRRRARRQRRLPCRPWRGICADRDRAPARTVAWHDPTRTAHFRPGTSDLLTVLQGPRSRNAGHADRTRTLTVTERRTC